MRKNKPKTAQKVSSKYFGWALSIAIITFALAILFSFVAQIANKSDILVSFMLLQFMILTSVVFDGIGVSVTSCNKVLFCEKYGKSNSKNCKLAIKLIENAEKVNNICNDVIGDMCGILCGACGLSIALKIDISQVWFNFVCIVVSSIIASLTVGGKALMKSFAVNNSCEFVLLTAKIINLFKFARQK
ncbi:MAG: hypothetical protein RSB10_01430 [Clostridia bacterium]